MIELLGGSAVAVELIDRELVVRGTASCYYVKQLALQGVLDVLHGLQEVKVRLNFQVIVCAPVPRELTLLAE